MVKNNLLKATQESFKCFIEKGSSRSTAKLKPLHGTIAEDIQNKLGEDYIVISQGFGKDKEEKVKGEYYDKMVDITILNAHTNKPVAGIAVKFVMQNYCQNSNNYFENMLGETVNMRCADHLYFQILILPDYMPHYKRGGKIESWEKVTEYYLEKYFKLGKGNVDIFHHIPNKTLLYIIHPTPEIDKSKITTIKEYREHYKNSDITMELTDNQYSYNLNEGSVILNDYEKFINKIYYMIMAK